MGYKETYNLAGDTQLIEKLTVAVADVADDVFAEGAGVTDHALRMALVAHAGPVFSAYKSFARELALQVVQTYGLTLDSTDAEIKTAVANIWTSYAKLMEARGTITVTP